MDRLLTDEEQAGLIWEISATIEGSEGRQPTQEEIHDYLLKAQDDLTAHLVAQDILDELEEKCNCYPDFDFDDLKGACPRCRRIIRSKWGIEQSGLYSISYE
jgi:hypothetical protein